jgi:hypothetical protein
MNFSCNFPRKVNVRKAAPRKVAVQKAALSLFSHESSMRNRTISGCLAGLAWLCLCASDHCADYQLDSTTNGQARADGSVDGTWHRFE